jgi:UDP-glucose 4-epimerase
MRATEAVRPQVAVVGARGFIGRAVVAALGARGVSTTGLGSDRPAVLHGELHPAVVAATTVVVVSGRSNPALAEREPSTAARELADDSELFGRLADAAERRSDPQRLLLASSGGAVYDTRHEPPFSERTPTSPASAYARLKLDVEDAFFAGASEHSPRTVLRLSNVYGPGQRLGTGQGVVGHWFEALRAGRPVRLFGDPETIRDYIYVADAADAFVAAHSAPGWLPPVLNIGSGEPTSLRRLLELVLAAADRPHEEVSLTSDRPFDRRHTWLDVTAAHDVLGWRTVTSLPAGLRRTWNRAATSQAPENLVHRP